MPAQFEIRRLTIEDADTCDQIILSLPYHFGYESGRQECAHAVRTSEGLVAVVNQQVVGFLTLRRHFDTTTEITWMAVHAQHRRQGIGRALIQHLRQDLQDQGSLLLIVTTLAPSYDEGNVADGYHGTRMFYKAQGFIPACELPRFWSVDSDPALLLVMPLQR